MNWNYTFKCFQPNEGETALLLSLHLSSIRNLSSVGLRASLFFFLILYSRIPNSTIENQVLNSKFYLLSSCYVSVSAS